MRGDTRKRRRLALPPAIHPGAGSAPLGLLADVAAPWRRVARFAVAGLPVGQPRVRAFVRRDGLSAGVYDPGTADDWRASIEVEAVRMGLETAPPGGVVALVLLFLMPRPESHHRKDGGLRGSAPLYHVQRPDLDNLQKAVMDALTSAGAWSDDAQVVSVSAGKAWADHGQWCGVLIAVDMLNGTEAAT